MHGAMPQPHRLYRDTRHLPALAIEQSLPAHHPPARSCQRAPSNSPELLRTHHPPASYLHLGPSGRRSPAASRAQLHHTQEVARRSFSRDVCATQWGYCQRGCTAPHRKMPSHFLYFCLSLMGISASERQHACSCLDTK